jgi:hypothetical protein
VKIKEDLEGKKVLEVKLKCPKESKTGRTVLVDIYESGGTLCPIKAFTRWWDRTGKETKLPVFRDGNGVLVTGARMNSWLKLLLGKHVDYEKGKFTGHSFHIGLATTMGTLGFSEDDVKEAGRWSSNAYEVYMRLPRKKRQAVAEQISKLR